MFHSLHRIPINDDDYSDATRIVQSHENALVVLPSSYRFKEKLINAVRLETDLRASSSILSAGRDCANGNSCEKRRNTRRRTLNHSGQSTASNSSRSLHGSRNEAFSQSSSQTPLRTDSHQTGSVLFLPNIDFSLSKAKSSCALISVANMPCLLLPDERLAFLSHIFGDDLVYIRVVGALLSFVVHQAVLVTANKSDDTIHITAIFYRNYADAMRISATTMRALSVFRDEMHPIGCGGMRGKEGGSLYGLLKCHVKTQSARHLLRSWLTYPSTNIKVIEERQFIVRSFLDGSNRALAVALRDSLTGVKNVRNLIMRFHQVTAGLAEWKGLYDSAKSFISLLEALKTASLQRDDLMESPLIRKTLNIREDDLQQVVSWIYSVVDFDESQATGRLIVTEGFSEEIDNLKRSFCAMDDFLTGIGAQEHGRLTSLPNFPSIRWLLVEYKLQIGFLIVLPHDDVESVGLSVLEGFGLTFVFHSKEKGYYFRNERCQKLDEDIGDIQACILELERKAYLYLEKNVLAYEESLCAMADIVCEMDCLQGMAACAREHSWTVPKVCDGGNEMVIEDGAHALLSYNMTSFVKNSTQMKSGEVHIVTG